MGRKQRPQGTIEDLNNTLFYLSRKVLDEKSLIGQATITAQIQNIKSIKSAMSKGDCFYCWKCIKSLIKKSNPFFWFPFSKDLRMVTVELRKFNRGKGDIPHLIDMREAWCYVLNFQKRSKYRVLYDHTT